MGWGRNRSWSYWKPYVPVARRQANAAAEAKRLSKNGKKLEPIAIEGRNIADTFWGKAWCDNLEAYSDFANRLPRGRTYVRNGSVIDLKIASGQITALVSGSSIYTVKIKIATLPSAQWKQILKDCSQSIDSLFDLLQGKLADGVMQKLTAPKTGLFPEPKQIDLSCSCPDYADMCKHCAAVLYGVGARLDHAPELLFLLRQVDHHELIQKAVGSAELNSALSGGAPAALEGEDLGALFGIELDSGSGAGKASPPARGRKATKVTKAKPAAVVTRTTVNQKADPVPPAKSPARKKSAAKTGAVATLPAKRAKAATADPVASPTAAKAAVRTRKLKVAGAKKVRKLEAVEPPPQPAGKAKPTSRRRRAK